ncbi:uncharacterized protein LOC135144503 isoform X2 [Zophobas morio]|uniref:uncharacterized protein LOC135144503 isoform X2 n=1 Tax=Zophobas morio TaxID=2755281 RepID=UPI003082C01C
MDLLHKYLPLPHSFAIFWAGSSIAIAIEAKSKFKAKTLEKKVAFDVGRHVFKSQARRADAIIKGETVPPGNSHAVLVGFEIVKCLALLRV